MTSTHDDTAPASKSGDAAPAIVRVPFDAPWNWLAAGWRDLWATPQISLIYGGVFAGIAWFFLLALALSSALPLILPLAGGFLLLGPVLAVGLYEISRKRERGEATSWADISAVIRENGSRLALFGVALLLLFIFWMRVAFLLFMLFFGAASYPSAETLVSTLLFTWHGLGLAIVGTTVGALFALVAYAISAISVPMLLDRHVDVVTAIIQSVQAVRTNPEAMLLWAALILGIVALGCLTLFVGLTIAFPLVGHASWHAYRELTGTR
ncbi:DUF2189 domain-containing protein [Rhodomicrobium udaipurense]|uniref:DUF2189 domain-containing protein n=1 Tax=Rhodomicrobium udaipurense TaxID=1202716 RepID=A0A8I1KIS8_9HYPH|nr:DUF2189 domain-containing protein [Rhodomicrobium udaipurense]MBJ7542967.1 DUF2189 domain-containing protein [Rhodomicrobium udaipurense]